MVMLTIFFKHGETRPLGDLNAQLEKQGFYKAHPRGLKPAAGAFN